ncbi:hypothetical protein FHR24_000777 [Wenyingzhuangia heitensis]|uniref:Acyl-coenzyme A thioesterase PaaI, contains HGG motif n=1 Tax=Wenyingzhuangia heitensis TaxID=1487859 RepID=A0ABX0U665_9FLAO|nr:DUF4442 domain-containing protein [Wenyingzhuangia heitensis]NIJ44338.1 hypothetical protein [Wenyingzhuangia heitensis]
MKLSAKQLNRFIIFKLPSAYLCGVRVLMLTHQQCNTRVRFKWINQNPFKSIYFAVLAMAAELSTGALVLKNVYNTTYKFSTLVVGMNAQFYKKAVGKITFICDDTRELEHSINKAIESKEGVTFLLSTKGIDEMGDEVAKFEFNWSIKIKKNLIE